LNIPGRCDLSASRAVLQPCDLGSINHNPAPANTSSYPITQIATNVCTTNPESPLSTRRPTLSGWSRERSRCFCSWSGSRSTRRECSKSQRPQHTIHRHRCCSVAAQRRFLGLYSRPLRFFLCQWYRNSQVAHYKSRFVVSTPFESSC